MKTPINHIDNYNVSEYELANPRDMIACYCSHCGNKFDRSKIDVRASIRYNKRRKLYCSIACDNKGRQSKRIRVSCSNCTTELKRLPNVFKKSKTGRFFCDKSCAATYNNKHKTHGTRRSKLEAVLESYIKETFPIIKMLCNDKSAIGSELDFYFPDLQFAIELNGIFHYEPIYGQKKLGQIQNNDNRKIIACYEQDIELAIIDSSSCKHVTEKTKLKYSLIVKNLLDTVIKNRNSL